MSSIYTFLEIIGAGRDDLGPSFDQAAKRSATYCWSQTVCLPD